MIGEQSFEGRRENLSQANKLSRTYAVLLDALNHHRGKGQQKVTVEHVHVHSGGQAVVGMVETPGGGSQQKSKEQPHAIAFAPGVEMPSANSERSTVPSCRMGVKHKTAGFSTRSAQGMSGFLFNLVACLQREPQCNRGIASCQLCRQLSSSLITALLVIRRELTPVPPTCFEAEIQETWLASTT
jgi:hypothetical protein